MGQNSKIEIFGDNHLSYIERPIQRIKKKTLDLVLGYYKPLLFKISWKLDKILKMRFLSIITRPAYRATISKFMINNFGFGFRILWTTLFPNFNKMLQKSKIKIFDDNHQACWGFFNAFIINSRSGVYYVFAFSIRPSVCPSNVRTS